MSETKLTLPGDESYTLASPPPNDIIFRVDNDKEILRLSANGDILIRGRLTANDQEIVEGFRELLRGFGLYGK
jgi:hypothetical protein